MPKISRAVQANKQFPAVETSGCVARITFLDTLSPEIRELIEVAEGMHLHGLWRLLGQARLLASWHPKVQAAATVVSFPAGKRVVAAGKGGAA